MEHYQNDSSADIGVDNPQNNPDDTVSDISFTNQNINSICCSCWDGSLRIYEFQQRYSYMNSNNGNLIMKGCFQYPEPLLCCDWGKDCQYLFAGTGDNKVMCVDLEKNISQIIGQHNGPVIKIFWMKDQNMLATFSYDQTFKFWQLGNQQPAAKFLLDHKIYAADIMNPIIALGLSDQKVIIEDINNLKYIRQFNYHESMLGKDSQISSIGLGLEKKNYNQTQLMITVSSIDGRTNVSNLYNDNDKFKVESQITFKSQKQDVNDYNSKKQILYPINASGFNCRYGKFLFTAGGDGVINFWDREAKNKIKQFSYNKCPVSAAKISQDGKQLAYALGYDWQAGIEGINQYKPKIFLHLIPESEIKYNK